MKINILIAVFIGLLLPGTALAGGKLSDHKTAQAKKQVSQWVQQQPVQFLENKGQMTDMEGKPVPFVLFKAEAPCMNMYVTERGLTYVFIKA